MCNYCEKNIEFEIEKKPEDTSLLVEGATLVMCYESYSRYYDIERHDIKINFCPMCGRELKESQDLLPSYFDKIEDEDLDMEDLAQIPIKQVNTLSAENEIMFKEVQMSMAKKREEILVGLLKPMRDKATMAYCSCCKEDGIGRDINCKQDSEECPFAQRFVKILDD